VPFEIDRLGLDLWRWTIHTPAPPGFRLIGQIRGDQDAAITHCRTLIDGRPASDEARGILKATD
jgi:hypothetical protein